MKSMKLLSFLAVFSLLLSTGGTALATSHTKRTSTKKATTTKKRAAAPKPAPVDPAVAIENLRTKGGAEIERRLNLLNKGFEQLKQTNKLKPAHVGELAKQAQAEAALLSELKVKVKEETELSLMREHIKALNSQYFPFKVLSSKMMLSAANNSAAESGASLVKAATILKDQIERAELQGKDASAYKQPYLQIEQQLIKANKDYQEIDTALHAVTPDNAGGNLAPLVAQKERLKALNSDISATYTAISQLSQSLQSLGFDPAL